MKPLHHLLAIALASLALTLPLTGCGSDDNDDSASTPSTKYKVTNPQRTILMYYPWSGGNGNVLTSYFWGNIESMKKAYDSYAATDRMVVFIATSESQGYIFDLSDYTGHTDNALAQYQKVNSPEFTTASGIVSILNKMRSIVPAPSYALIIGCHGQGWIPTSVNNTANKVKRPGYVPFRPHWDYELSEGTPVTRLFGGTSAKYQTDISTLAEAISQFGAKMDYILFDDCYMATVEVAYDLRQSADWLVACPTEVMGDGILGANVGRYLLGTPDYNALCETFRSYYVSYSYASISYPYGTISAIKCSEVDSLSRVMKKINALYTFDASRTSSLQSMDGYTPTIFFDMGDYVSKLCPDNTLYEEAKAQLERTVPYKAHTGKYPSTVSGNLKAYTISTYSGLTIGEPTQYSALIPLYPTLAWYEATH